MNQIRIIKKYVDPKYPNLPFEEGVIFDALLPLGGTYKSAAVQRVISNPNKNVDSSNMVTIDVPKEYWEIFSGMPQYVKILNTPEEQKSEIQPTKSNTSTKYIILGIVVIGFVSFLVMTKGKKIKK